MITFERSMEIHVLHKLEMSTRAIVKEFSIPRNTVRLHLKADVAPTTHPIFTTASG